MVRCAKTTEPIDMPFWMNLAGPTDPCIRCGANPPRGRGIFWGLSGHSKALEIFAAPVVTKGIIQSPLTSCSRRDHSIRQANANSILKMQCIGSISVRISLQRTNLASIYLFTVNSIGQNSISYY